jgi:tetratricopeptide (TPR) repeat protein
MFLPQKIRTVLSAVIAASIFSQPLFAFPAIGALAQPTTIVRFLIKPKHAEAIYRHLVEVHWTPRTGLFRSFPDSNDLKLSQQASTYEQAAMGLLCLRFGDLERADQLFHFFKNAWESGPNQSGARHGLRGLVNFYNADFGTEGIEKIIHVGPNAWAGLFAAMLANQTKNAEALQWALDVEYWIANVLPHDRGGVAMGLRDDPYGAPWSRIYSTENNLSYYAFLTELLRNSTLDKPIRLAITLERDRVENWLVRVAYDPAQARMLRGINPQGADRMQALDTVTWLISAVGPKRLAARGIDPERLMQNAQKAFEVSVDNRGGVDPTDQQEADSTFAELRSHLEERNRPKEDHHRVIWYEGLGQYILAWSALGAYAEKAGEKEKAAADMQKVETLTQMFDEAALKHYPGQSAYAYASPGKFFRYGWGAPKESDKGPASSLIAGIWRCFVGLGFDPMAGQDVETIEHVRVTLPENIHLAGRRAAVLYGTSEDMTTEAWNALSAGNWDHAIDQSEAAIQEWAPAAMHLQDQKMRDLGRLVDYSGDPGERKTIFKYWALNDVAAAYFILGQAQDHKGDYAKASRAFRQVVNHYSLAQIWDPKGWFWSPVDAITTDYVLRDRAHYGWVLPDMVAENSKIGKRPL